MGTMIIGQLHYIFNEVNLIYVLFRGLALIFFFFLVHRHHWYHPPLKKKKVSFAFQWQISSWNLRRGQCWIYEKLTESKWRDVRRSKTWFITTQTLGAAPAGLKENYRNTHFQLLGSAAVVCCPVCSSLISCLRHCVEDIGIIVLQPGLTFKPLTYCSASNWI